MSHKAGCINDGVTSRCKDSGLADAGSRMGKHGIDLTRPDCHHPGGDHDKIPKYKAVDPGCTIGIVLSKPSLGSV